MAFQVLRVRTDRGDMRSVSPSEAVRGDQGLTYNQATNIMDWLNLLGERGWELVAVVAVDTTYFDREYYFQREVPDPS